MWTHYLGFPASTRGAGLPVESSWVTTVCVREDGKTLWRYTGYLLWQCHQIPASDRELKDTKLRGKAPNMFLMCDRAQRTPLHCLFQFSRCSKTRKRTQLVWVNICRFGSLVQRVDTVRALGKFAIQFRYILCLEFCQMSLKWFLELSCLLRVWLELY